MYSTPCSITKEEHSQPVRRDCKKWRCQCVYWGNYGSQFPLLVQPVSNGGEVGNAMLASGPNTVVAVRGAATCSYIFYYNKDLVIFRDFMQKRFILYYNMKMEFLPLGWFFLCCTLPCQTMLSFWVCLKSHCSRSCQPSSSSVFISNRPLFSTSKIGF